MNVEHRRILSDKRDILLENVDFQKIKQLLMEYKMFNAYMWRDVISMEGLLDALPHRGPKAFHNIIEIFRKTGYDQEADALEKSETELFHKMASQPLGYCLIINNVEFDKSNTNDASKTKKNLDRLGSDTDAKSLNSFFENAGFEVITKRNMKAKKMTNFLKSFSKDESLKNVDSLIVIIMSHGAQKNNVDIVYGTDWNYVQKRNILDIFNNLCCNVLRSKPKIFLFITCRGSDKDYGVSYCIPNDSQDTGCIQNNDVLKCESSIITSDTACNIVSPTTSEMFLVHSTLPCQVSVRDHEKGTYFCEAFINVLKRYSQILDLNGIINLVNVQLMRKVSPEYGVCQSAHYETLGTTKSVKFCHT